MSLLTLTETPELVGAGQVCVRLKHYRLLVMNPSKVAT